MYSVGSHVWVHDESSNEFSIPKGCKILQIEKKKIQVQDDDGTVEWLKPEKIIKAMEPSLINPVEDMSLVGDLQEYSILRNLRLRYNSNLIYTYIGDILVAVNPYQPLNIYSEEEMKLHSEKSSASPHIFAISAASYKTMRDTKKNQCIQISGESGAGKTESAKLVLQYLTRFSCTNNNLEIKRLILETNPILEAFGNAKTQRNKNSSRFGKYTKIFFNKNGEIVGGQIDYYLLEKSRVVTQSKNERNYHIFYALLAGINNREKEKLNLSGKPSDYKYLGETILSGDEKTFADVQNAMSVLKRDDKMFDNITSLLAMILHLGNLKYGDIIIAHNDTIEVQNKECLKVISDLLGVDQNVALEFLTRKTIFAYGEKIISNLTKNQALEVRDAFAKLIFEKIFDIIIGEINNSLNVSDSKIKNTIGILDISGFENFEINSFEQLCINYASERLQQLFVQDVFKIEQQVYASENIFWKNIDFVDNQEIISLIGLKRSNIMALIDEEAKVPQGSDSKLLLKINSIHKNNEILIQPKSKLSKDKFGICHFAGPVFYTVTGFLDRNRDTCSGNTEELVEASTNKFLKSLFFKQVSTNFNLKKRSITLSMKFRSSLDSLLKTIQDSNPLYIRCIKPNNDQVPQVFDKSLGCRQLRYLGLTEAARIRQAGFAVRYDYDDFVEEFRLLIPEEDLEKDSRSITEKICSNILQKQCQFARTKVFLKNSENEILLAEKKRVFTTLIIKKNLLMWIYRRRFLKLKNATIVIQKNWKKILMVKKFQRTRKMTISLQTYCRRYLIKKILEQRKNEKILAMNTLENNEIIKTEISAEVNTESKIIESNFKFLVESSDQISNCSGENGSLNLHDNLEPKTAVDDFQKYSNLHFVENVTLDFSHRPLNQSLLDLPESDQKAAKALSQTILRYMSDLAEPENYTSSYEFTNGAKQSSLLNNKSLASDRLSLKKMNKLSNIVNKDMSEGDYRNWLSMTRSSVEKLNFIIGHGILFPQLRDEIYCQIVRQLVNNPLEISYKSGLKLLSFCVGCFPPSTKLYPYLKTFLNEKSEFSALRLERIYKNGARTQPPCLKESEHVLNEETIVLEVDLMNGLKHSVEVDSATNAREIVEEIANRLNLVETFGFSLFVSIEDEVLSLEADKYYVMDAISKCEQYEIEQGRSDSMKYKDKICEFYLKKEMFSPWIDPFTDEVAVDLIYHQICKDILNKELLSKTVDVADVVAKYLVLENLSENLTKNLPAFLKKILPRNLIQSHLIATVQILVEYYKKELNSKKISPISIKRDVVAYAKRSWPLLFSKYYVATKSDSSHFSSANETIIAINSKGIYLIDHNENESPEFLFSEILNVHYEKHHDSALHKFKILTIKKKEYYFDSIEAENIVSFVEYILNELRFRSKYAIAIKSYTNNDDDPTSKFFFQEGDIIELIDDCDGNNVMTSPRAAGKVNGKNGRFPRDCIYVIPTVEKPSQDLVEALKENLRDTSFILSKLHHELIDEISKRNCYDLKKFAADHFRKSKVGLKTISESEKLWKHTKKPIEAPLLAKLSNKADECEQAKKMFTNILKYMEELTNHKLNGTPLTDDLFVPALKNELLRDELYCQLMRQLTRNRNPTSEDRGWELMWLATGIMTCEPLVRKELELFLTSRDTTLSKECFSRLKIIEGLKTNRKHPPHSLEVKRIQLTKNLQNLKIFHQVFFPDGSANKYEVHSSTKVLDLCREISKRLKLKRPEDFSLYIKIGDHCVPFPMREFFYDFFYFVRDTLNLFSDKNILDVSYQLLFLRKIWIHCQPRNDLDADLKFHYYQELDQYLKGYRKCKSFEDAVLLAIFIYKSEYGQDNSELKNINNSTLEKYIPKDIIRKIKTTEWKNSIVAACYDPRQKLSKEEAKLLFLQRMYRTTSFGTEIIEVRQNSETKYPSLILIGIGEKGVSIIDPKNKDVLATYSFDNIIVTEFSDKSIRIIIKNLNEESEIICETKYGYKMNDLIFAYTESLKILKESL